MADAIKVYVTLEPRDISAAGDKIAKQLENALDRQGGRIRDIGKRYGDALTAGMSGAVEAARRLRAQLDAAVSPDQRQAAAEAKERGHQQRLTEIRERSAQQQAVSAAKSANQAAVIAEKSAAQRAAIEARGAEQRATIAERSAAQDEIIRKRAAADAVKIEERKNAQLAIIQARADADAEKIQRRALARQSQFGDQLRNIGTALTAAVTVPLALIGKEILAIGIEYEKSLNTFQAVTRATTAEMTAASAVAKQLGADITLPATSAADAARALTELSKGGLSAQQAMDAARGTLLLAAAAQIEEAQAAEIAANALNAFKLPASEATRIADLLAAASNASSAEITDFAQAMQQSSASAAALKIPIEDTVTALGLLANAGIRGSDSGTTLKTALLRLNPDTDKAAEAMRALGVNAFDAQGKLLPLRNIIDQFSGAFGKLTDQQKIQAANTIFGTDAMRAALIVFGGGVEQFDKLSAAVNKTGAAQELAAAKTKGLGGAYEALKSQLETGAILAFERLKGPLEAVTKFAAEGIGKILNFAEGLAKSNPALLDTTLAFAGIAAVIGPVTLGIAALVAALGTIGAPALAVVAVITAAAAAIGGAWATNFLGIRDVTFKVFGEVSKFATEQLGVIVGFYRENLPIIKEAVANAVAAIRAFWKENGDEITTIVRETWNIIKTVVSTAIKTVLDLIKLAAQIINGDWSGAWETFKGIVFRAVEAVASVLQSLENRFIAGLKLLGNSLLQVGTAIKGALLALGTNIILGIIEGVKSKATEFYNTVKGVVSGGIGVAKAALGIQSPSKVFFAIGQNVGEGYALGIEASKKRISRAMSDTIKASIVALPDPLEILAQVRKTERDADQLRSDTNSRLSPLAIDPTQLGIETLKRRAIEAEDVPPISPELLAQQTGAADGFRRQLEEGQRAAEQFQQTVSGLFRTLIDSGPRAAFGSLVSLVKNSLSQILSDIAGSGITRALRGLFNIGGSTGGGASSGGGFSLGNIASIFTGNRSGATSALTPGFAGGGGAAAILGGGGSLPSFAANSGGGKFLLDNIFGGGGLSAPSSVSLSGFPPGFSPISQGDFGAGGAGLGNPSGLASLFSGIGFGKQAGSGGALAGLLPLLGVGLGSSLGTDRLTSILGGVAGGALGIGLTAAPALIGAGGALSGLGFLAPLFSNPITAIAAGLALPAIFLLGRARQRRRDEATSGDSLQRAIDEIKGLRKSAEGGELTSISTAEDAFRQIRDTFVNETLQLKTKSVRESRINNQADITPPLHPDSLRLLFEKEVLPAVQKAKESSKNALRLLPEFHTGGLSRNEQLAVLMTNEVVLTQQQQRRAVDMAGFNIFQAVGVPDAPQIGPSGLPAFHAGGFVQPAPSGGQGGPVILQIAEISLSVGESDLSEMFVRGAQTSDGRAVLVHVDRQARRNREK